VIAEPGYQRMAAPHAQARHPDERFGDARCIVDGVRCVGVGSHFLGANDVALDRARDSWDVEGERDRGEQAAEWVTAADVRLLVGYHDLEIGVAVSANPSRRSAPQSGSSIATCAAAHGWVRPNRVAAQR
jgi:hypothetical protein